MNALDLSSLNKLVVAAYKAAGFLVLSVLLFGLVSFIGLNALFYVNRSWLAPTVVSPSDERVLTLAVQLAQQQTNREKLATEHADLGVRLAEAQRSLATQKAFQAEFRRTVEAELAARSLELRRLAILHRRFLADRDEIVTANGAYAQASRERLKQMWDARLVSADGYASAGRELSQIAQSGLSLAEQEAQIETRLAGLRRDIGALEAMARSASGAEATGGAGGLSYEVLRMRQEYDRSVTELARAEGSSEVLAKAVAASESALARFDRVLKSVQDAPLLQASNGRVTIAFVPYDNVASAVVGSPVYGCRLGVLWCGRVGEVAGVLDGEVTGRHPLYPQPERGLLVRLELAEPRWSKERVLFTGRAPLFI